VNKSKRIIEAGHVAPMGELTNIHKISVVKVEGKKLARRPSRRWEDKKMDHKEIGWAGVDWTHRMTGFLDFVHRHAF
jgi:hypothetical protein